jgi:hypothetical protein
MNAAQAKQGTRGRYFLVQDGLTLKERNAARKQYEADGWTVETYGSNRRGWTVQGWKGEAPTIIRESFALTQHGENSITPLYRRQDGGEGWEYIDGTPERD